MPRYNRFDNPSAANNTSGYQSGGSITRVTGLSGPPRTTGVSIAMGSGAFSSFLRTPLVSASNGQVESGAVWARSSVTRTLRIDIGTYNGGSFVANNFDINDVSFTANVWQRVRVLGTVTNGPGAFNQTAILFDLPTSGSAGTLTVSSCRIEQVNDASIEYGDGDSGGGWSWDGTAGSSSSTMADAILPTGRSSTREFGTTVTTPGPVTISSAGRTSTRAFGQSLISRGLIRPTGRVSTRRFGTTAVTPGPVAILPVGRVSTRRFGTTRTIITLDAAAARARPRRNNATYEVVLVARNMQTTGPPQFFEVDPIDWKELTLVEELSAPSSLDVTVEVSSLPDAIIQRLQYPEYLPSEIRLYRNTRLIYAGPMLWYRAQDDEHITITSRGLLYYLRGFWIHTADKVFANTDQFAIVKWLVDQWQAQTFADFGIDTSDIATSGVLRDQTYKWLERHEVLQRIQELGERQNGFDVAIDPASRALQLWYPYQGVDRSTGPDSIVIDSASITSSDLMCSAGAGDIASVAFGVGTSTDHDPVQSVKTNDELMAKFGRWGVFSAFDGVSEQATADAHTQGLLDARGQALLIPGPDARVTVDTDLSRYRVGDTISTQLHTRLNVGGAYRIRRRTTRVSSVGQETVSNEFV